MRLMFALLAALCLGSFAQAEAQVKTTFFGTDTGACLQALRNGEFSYYTPVDTSGRGKNLATGPNRKLAPLEADACVRMKTTAGWQIVVRPKGSIMRWELVNGVWEVYADDTCGNNANEVTYLAALPPMSRQHFGGDTVVVKHIGEIDVRVTGSFVPPPSPTPVVTMTPVSSVRIEHGRFWCFKNILTGGVCLVGGALVVKGTMAVIDLLSNDDDFEGYTGPGFRIYFP